MFGRKTVGVGIAVVVLFVFGFSQMYAQSGLTLEGLSRRIAILNQRVSTLSNTKVSNHELAPLENRVATLEAKLGITPVATTTRRRPTLTPTTRPPTSTPTRRPTSTPTKVRPTATSTPAQPYIRIASRNMNVRSGPGVNYTVIGYATTGQEFDITGRNADGTWWRIDFEGENAWIYAPYVTDFYADRIRSVPTPIPPTATPHPTSPPSSQQESDFTVLEQAVMLVAMDRQRSDLQQNWNNLSQEERDRIVAGTVILLELVAEYCQMSTSAATVMINGYAQDLDDAGYTTRNDIRARATLMYILIDMEEAARSSSGCHNWLAQVHRTVGEKGTGWRVTSNRESVNPPTDFHHQGHKPTTANSVPK